MAFVRDDQNQYRATGYSERGSANRFNGGDAANRCRVAVGDAQTVPYELI
jgi:hypothetical protein